MSLQRFQPGDNVRDPRFRERLNAIIEALEDVLRPSMGVVPPPPLSGAGQQAMLVRVKSVANDYLVCRAWDGTTEGDTDLYVAKPYKLRHVAANYGLNPANITTLNPQIIRINNITPVRNWYVTPWYYANDPLWVDIVNWTGVTASIPGVPGGTITLTYLDANKDARAWAQEA